LELYLEADHGNYLRFDKDFDYLLIEIRSETTTFTFKVFATSDFELLKVMFDKALRNIRLIKSDEFVEAYTSESHKFNKVNIMLSTTRYAILTINNIEFVLSEFEVSVIHAFLESM